MENTFNRSSLNIVKVGLVGVGLDTYWKQFDGLKQRLEGYQNEICRKMCSMNTDVINVSIIDSQSSAIQAINVLLEKRWKCCLFLFRPMLFHLQYCQ